MSKKHNIKSTEGIVAHYISYKEIGMQFVRHDNAVPHVTQIEGDYKIRLAFYQSMRYCECAPLNIWMGYLFGGSLKWLEDLLRLLLRTLTELKSVRRNQGRGKGKQEMNQCRSLVVLTQKIQLLLRKSLRVILFHTKVILI